MTNETKIVYKMALDFCDLNEDEFLEDVFNEVQGVQVSCHDLEVLVEMGAIENPDDNSVHWHDMYIWCDPYEDWDADEM